MKKTILLLTICLACITAHAQKIDKTLLYGRWDLYTMSGAEHNICRDSTTELIQAMIRSQRAKNPTQQLAPNDSIALIVVARGKLADLFKTYMTFDEKGNTKVLLGFDSDENGEFSEETGTYEWSGADRIVQRIGKSDPVVFIITELTAAKLAIQAEDKDGNKDLEMTFTRAK